MISANKRRVALEALTAYADEIRTEIKRQTRELSRELERVEKSIAELSGGEPRGPVEMASTATLGEYAGLGPQAAVEKFLAANPDELVRSNELATFLKERGLAVTNPKLLRQQVLIAIHRAVNKGIAAVKEVDGKKVYVWAGTKTD